MAVALAIVVLFLGIQTKRLESSKAEHAAFVAQVAAQGKAAEEAAAKQKLHDMKNKERTDEEYNRRVAEFTRTIAGLRQRAPGSFVPAAPAGASRPELACYDRAELVGAVGKFVAGARAIADEGTKESLMMDAARAWARGNR